MGSESEPHPPPSRPQEKAPVMPARKARSSAPSKFHSYDPPQSAASHRAHTWMLVEMNAPRKPPTAKRISLFSPSPCTQGEGWGEGSSYFAASCDCPNLKQKFCRHANESNRLESSRAPDPGESVA